MIKVEVKNIKNGKQFSAEFKTQSEADAWTIEQTKLNSWGDSESDFTIDSVDISKEVNQQKHIEKVKEEQLRGNRLREKLSAMLREKLISGSLTLEELSTFVELPSVLQVERYLSNGYLTLAKIAMQKGEFGGIISEEERQTFIEEL